MDELEELLSVVRLKEERIEELEEALRESVRITADRERGLQQEEVRRKQIMEKVGAKTNYSYTGCFKVLLKILVELLNMLKITVLMNKCSKMLIFPSVFMCVTLLTI